MLPMWKCCQLPVLPMANWGWLASGRTLPPRGAAETFAARPAPRLGGNRFPLDFSNVNV